MSRRESRSKLADRAAPRPSTSSIRPGYLTDPDLGAESEDTFGYLGERLRRLALGLTAMLFVARAYFPSEDAETGSGLIWVFGMLGALSLGIASSLFSGVTRLRWSWADAGVLALMLLVGLSTANAPERRAAITMGWEWAGLGMMYFLVRNLPRTRGESSAIAASVVATAVALSAYAIYQVTVELPKIRLTFLKAPELFYARMGITPGTPAAEGLKQRVLYSTEAFSTFALANSFAGFLVGPIALALAIAFENWRREGKGSRVVSYLLASVPGLLMLVCLMLTKSRSAQVGLFLAILVLFWRARRVTSTRVLTLTGVGLATIFAGLVGVGLATKQLDIQVLTESNKSLRYRLEYWAGAWGVITDAPSPYATAGLVDLPMVPGANAEESLRRTFWRGLGPANFAGPYLGQKLPQASEEIQDPHNMILEVWASSGVFAVVALLASLGIGLREALGPARPPQGEATAVIHDQSRVANPLKDPTAPPLRASWLVVMAGMGWLLVWVLGKLNPLSDWDSLARWSILGFAWALAVLLGTALWKRREIPPSGVGLGMMALAVNLLASGGIGIPSVAMALWMMLALALNLREDRPCGRLREVGKLGPAVALACVWAMVAGTYFGAVVPSWKAQAAMADGDAAMSLSPPAYEIAQDAYIRAYRADRYDPRPWLGLAEMQYRLWRSPEGRARKEPIWQKVIISIDNALSNGRNPNNLGLRRQQAKYARMILNDLPERATALELLHVKSVIVRAVRREVMIYPTSPALRAELAQASADIGYFPDAAQEARQALRFDSLTPHKDKQLPKDVKTHLETMIPQWEKKASEPIPEPPSLPKPPGRPGR